jgi:hypothetical protein
VAAAATDLMKSLTPAKIEECTHSDPVIWANESFAIAERAQTKYCDQRGSSAHPASEGEDRRGLAKMSLNEMRKHIGSTHPI